MNSRQQAVFPDLPRNQPVVDKEGNMDALWQLFLANLVMALQVNFKPTGIVVPSLSTGDIASLTDETANIIYDSTTNEFKGNVNGTWKVFTLT